MAQNEMLSPGYRHALEVQYPHFTAQCDDIRYAPLPSDTDAIPYLRVGPDTPPARGSRPVLYVPGFTEGIVAKLPFAAELASRGVNVMLPDQSRAGILRDATSKKSATFTQASHMMAILENERLTKEPGSVDVVTHSYGSLVFDTMRVIAEARGQQCFDDSEVIMLAPAGLNPRESTFSLATRFTQMLLDETRTIKQFDDPNGEMFRAGLGHAVANVPRAVRECLELATRKVDLDGPRGMLRSNIGHVTVLSFVDDVLFSDKIIEPTLNPILNSDAEAAHKLSWAAPVSLSEHGRMAGATHNDDQYHPLRVGRAVSFALFQAQDRRAVT